MFVNDLIVHHGFPASLTKKTLNPNAEFIIIIFLLSRLSLELSGFQLEEERWISLPFKDYCEYKVLKGVKEL